MYKFQQRTVVQIKGKARNDVLRKLLYVEQSLLRKLLGTELQEGDRHLLSGVLFGVRGLGTRV